MPYFEPLKQKKTDTVWPIHFAFFMDASVQQPRDKIAIVAHHFMPIWMENAAEWFERADNTCQKRDGIL